MTYRKKITLIICLATLILGFTFGLQAQAVQVCDVDGNGAIDRIDITQIFMARNTPASGPDDPRDADGDGWVTVNDGRLCVLQCTLPRCAIVTGSNTPPVADAGPDQTFFVGDTVTLDGSGSSDVDGDPLTFLWSLTSVPAGSAALLSDPTAVMPTFVVDVSGSYVVQLIVNDGTVNSAPDTVTITTANSPPVADAGPDQTIFVGNTVTLDGSGSSDVDGDPLTFLWSLTSVPAGSAALLSDPTAVMPTFVVDVSGSYVVQLIVNDGTVDSAPDTVTVTTANSPPVADAGPDQSVLVGDTVTLDSSGSSDVDGDPLTFSWSLTSVPAGSAALLSDPTAVMPTFVVDVSGSYVVQLIVNDGTVDSAPDSVTVTTANSPPVADAGPDQTVLVGDTVTLDGSGSSDVDGDPLTFFWSLISVPAGSGAVLSDPAATMPDFDIDVAGTYVAQLIVNDGTVDSAPDSVVIITANTPPVADAGPNQNVSVNDVVLLDGSGSSDVDGDALTFSWTLTSVPAGSAAALSDPTAVMPTFIADIAGAYIAELIVNDGTVDSAPDTVTITTGNSPPVADAGPDQTVLVNDTVTLDGSASSDVDGDALTFSWTLTSVPAGSAAALSDPTAVMPTFIADIAGAYIAELIVNDGTVDSAPDTVTITTGNSPPVADAGPDQTAFVGDTVTLNGSGSSDVDGDPLTFSWSLVAVPAGSAASLSDPMAVMPTFVVDVAGSYVVQLIVNDGSVDSAPDTVTITTANSPPVADAGPDQTALVGDTVTLDGSGSSDVDGDPLTYFWALISVPSGSGAVLSDPAAIMPTFDVDVAGTYVVQLIANDGTVDSAPDSVVIITANTPPVADAGPDQSVSVNDVVLLDGSGSSDVDGDPLTFLWSVVTFPQGSSPALSDPTAVMPTFVVDAAGTYVIELIVNDGTVDSTPDTVTIEATNMQADLSITKTDDVDPVIAGNTLTYTVAVNNAGPADAVNVVITDTLPAGVTFVSTSGCAEDPNGVPTCSLGTIASGGSAQYTITVTVDAGTSGTITNQATVASDTADPNTANNTATEDTVVNAEADLSITKTDDVDPVIAGNTLTYTVAVNNAGPADAVNVVITDTLPAGVTFVSTSGCAEDPNGVPTCSLGTIASGGSAQYTITVTVDAGTSGTITNQATVASDTADPNTANNTATEDTVVNAEADLSITKTDDVDPVIAGNTLTYTVAVNNAGPADAVNVVVTDTLPAGVTFVSTSGCAEDPNGVLTCSLGTIASGGSAQYTITVTVDAGTSGTITNQATVASDTADPNTTNNTATEDTVVNAPNSPPVADAGPDQTAIAGDTVQLDGSASSDPDGNPITYSWSVISGPSGSAATISNPTIVNPTVTVNLPGTYTVQLIVNDGAVDSTPDTVTITATVAPTISLTPPVVNLFTGGVSTMTINLNIPAGTGGQVVNLSSDNPAIASVPLNVTVPQGSTSNTFQVTAGSTTGVAQISASATGFAGDTSNVNVSNQSMSMTLSSTVVGVGRSIGGTVDLAQPAPPGGVTVNLGSLDSGVATVSPTNVVIPQGAQQASFNVTGVSDGSTTITADASGFNQATSPITVTSSLVSFGAVPPVAPAQVVSLPVSLTDPAPPGGVNISFTSSNPAIATITPSVFIPGGLQIPAANPQVTGILIGTVQVTGTAPGFAPDIVNVAVTLSLAFTPDPLTVIESNTNTVTLNMSAPAPPGGLSINLSTDDTGIATVPGVVVVSAGQTSAQITVTGVAVGSTILRANSPGLVEETATVNVNPAPPINISTATVGDDLQTQLSGTLGAPAPPGNLQVTITSADSSRLLVSTDPNVAGSGTINLQVNAGSSFIPTFYLQSLDDNGSVNITSSAPGYSSAVTSISLSPSGFAWFSNNFTTTTFSAPPNIQMRAYALQPGTLNSAGQQSVRAGLTVNVIATSSDTNVGTINSPFSFNGNQFFVNQPFAPVNAGQTNLIITQPAGFDVPANLNSTITATVTAPVINFSNTTVGEDLQTSTSLTLAASPPGPTDVMMTVNDPAVAVISDTATAVGSGNLTLSGVTGTFLGTFYVQGLQQGTTTLTITAAGYQTRIANITVTPSGFAWFSPNFTTTTFSSPLNIQLRAYALQPGTLNSAGQQSVRAGLTVNVIATSSDTNVGTINSPFSFNGNQFFVNQPFAPVNAGQTDLVITQPAGFDVPTNLNTTITATVTAPVINFSNTTVGEDLQTSSSLTLAASPPGPTDVMMTVNDPAVAVISDTATAVGSGNLTLSGVTGTFLGTFYVQGLQQGTTTLTITAAGYQTRIANITVTPSGFAWFSPNFTTTTFSSPLNIQMRAYALQSGTLNSAGQQTVRGGLTVNVPVTNTDTNVGTITSPYTFNGNQLIVNQPFSPGITGTTDLVITQPAGFDVPANLNTTITATVTAPDVNFNATTITVGEDLQIGVFISLAVAPPSPVDVVITSSSGTVATITDNQTLAGGPSVTFSGVTGTTVGTIYIQGRSQGSSTILTATAAGYSDDTLNVTVAPSGFYIFSPAQINTTAGSSNSSLTIRPALLNSTTLNVVQGQNLRGGLSVNVPVTSSNNPVGSITTSPVIFNANDFQLTTQFDPNSAGTAEISVGTPAGFDTPSNSRTITATVNP